ncbi:hypothetical protein P171DRAFT_449778 [Karstenula rhodostoma CBS 690.94]|uniref:Uncharacterized protein n=1 Tax=Karstenula rhodostoma CBS 690.94 TaxID=1392251 RepID=A0A9P4P5E3_9PLEO|nr:hypothetical protein P171DRAFT_449778 [Karstenula rhodostoma CBS 690.94]
MARSIRHKNDGVAPKARGAATTQTKWGRRKTTEQARKPAVKRVPRFVQKRASRSKAGIQNVGGRGQEADAEPAKLVDNTLPKDDKDREAWARKLYYALLNGPNLFPEAGATAWQVSRSTEKLFREGPSAAFLKANTAPAIVQQLKSVTFSQHFEDLVSFVEEQGVKSAVIACSAEELLMKVASAKKSTKAPTATELDANSELTRAMETTADCIDLTVELSEVDTDEDSSDEDSSDEDSSDDDRSDGDGSDGNGPDKDSSDEDSSYDDSSYDDSCAEADEAGSVGQGWENGDTMMLDYVSPREDAATALPIRTASRNAVIEHLAERSQRKGGAAVSSTSAAYKRTDARVPADQVTVDRASYFDPDPFWMVHLETMKNKRRSAVMRRY